MLLLLSNTKIGKKQEITVAKPLMQHSGLRLIVTFVVTLVLSACGTQPVVKETTELTSTERTQLPLSLGDIAVLENATSLMRDQKWKQAIKPLKKLQRKYPTNDIVAVNLASSYFASDNIDDAESICNEALSINNNSAEAHNLFGLISVERRKFTVAEASYKKAISLNANYANAHFNLALLYDMYYQEIPKAYQHYLKYLTLVPDDQSTKDWVEQLKYSLDQN